MLTDIRSRALLVLSLGLVPVESSLHAQAATPVAERFTHGTIELSYRLQALKRNKLGQYEMAGTLRGERRGEASVEFGFDNGSSGRPGHALVHAYWVVRAVPEAESFKARLRGTADMVSGQTHLVGTIHRRGRQGAAGGDQQPVPEFRTQRSAERHRRQHGYCGRESAIMAGPSMKELRARQLTTLGVGADLAAAESARVRAVAPQGRQPLAGEAPHLRAALRHAAVRAPIRVQVGRSDGEADCLRAEIW